MNDRLHDVLQHYPGPLRGPATPVENEESFSGARLWRLDGAGGGYCVRAWPPDGMTRDRLLSSGWRPCWHDGDPVASWARRAWDLVGQHGPAVPRRLARWAGRPVRVQPCLCDPWHANLLFDGDALTGLVDYGSVKQDH